MLFVSFMVIIESLYLSTLGMLFAKRVPFRKHSACFATLGITPLTHHRCDGKGRFEVLNSGKLGQAKRKDRPQARSFMCPWASLSTEGVQDPGFFCDVIQFEMAVRDHGTLSELTRRGFGRSERVS